MVKERGDIHIVYVGTSDVPESPPSKRMTFVVIDVTCMNRVRKISNVPAS